MNLSSGKDNDKMAYYLEKKKKKDLLMLAVAKINALESKAQITIKTIKNILYHCTDLGK